MAIDKRAVSMAQYTAYSALMDWQFKGFELGTPEHEAFIKATKKLARRACPQAFANEIWFGKVGHGSKIHACQGSHAMCGTAGGSFYGHRTGLISAHEVGEDEYTFSDITCEKCRTRFNERIAREAQQTEPATPPASADPELPESWRGYRAPAELPTQPDPIPFTDDDWAEASDRLLDVDRRDLRAEMIEHLMPTDSMPIPYSPDHDANERRYGFGDMEHAPCRICGRPVNLAAPATKMIHEHLGGGMIVTERLAALLPAASDLGMQVIGPECWHKHPEIARFLNK